MKHYLPCILADGTTKIETYYEAPDYREALIKASHWGACCNYNRKGFCYRNIICTFDIETTTVTTLTESPSGFMYHWQFCIMDMESGEYVTIIGRRWEQYFDFIRQFTFYCGIDSIHHAVIWVHNLAFEYQFMRDFMDLDSVFAVGKRKVVKMMSTDFVEYRCSYKLTNMSLAKFNEQSGALHAKKVDLFDYSKIRTTDTVLTDTEKEYCLFDVIGLAESMRWQMDDDTLDTIPLTSTGYVRRDCRLAMRKDYYNHILVWITRLNVEQYTLLKEASRGGNVASSRYFANRTWKNVYSFDATSSYPYQQMTQYFPVKPFRRINRVTSQETLSLYLHEYCCLFRVSLKNVQVRPDVPIPYIASYKCTTRINPVLFNGRVLKADALIMTLTEIDWEIIERQYDFEDVHLKDMYIAKRGLLPKELRDTIMSYFYNKTTLKGVDDYLYMKSKNKLNGIFGMSCTDIVREMWVYDKAHKEWRQSQWFYDDTGALVQVPLDTLSLLEKYYKKWNTFLAYQWGIWTMAHGRRHLQTLLDITGLGTIYADTDSSKCLNPDFDAIEKANAEIRALCEKRGAYVDYNGKRHYLGVFVHEATYDEFRTLGAKKYVYTENGELHVTVSGVKKKEGAKQLQEAGGIEAFRNGFVFDRGAAGQTLWYNDTEPHRININGCEMLTASNIGMLDTTYTVGLTNEFLENLQILSDF